MTTHHLKAGAGRDVINAQPDDMRWRYLGFRVILLAGGEHVELATSGVETAVVPLAGDGIVEVDADKTFELSRRGVFDDPASLVYVPPNAELSLTASRDWLVAVGTAPADGHYPLRHITPEDVSVEVRGGGSALRQVNHLLAPPLPAERLIVYEVFVPAGAWAGWPPHCHDGSHGSPYLEETYFFRFDRTGGFGFHRNYGEWDGLDETFAVSDLDCVAVPAGFHVTTAAPGNNMWILNFLAGDLIGEERGRPPYFDPSTTWITENWSRAPMKLPIAAAA